jgi:hypothetical protein
VITNEGGQRPYIWLHYCYFQWNIWKAVMHRNINIKYTMCILFIINYVIGMKCPRALVISDHPSFWEIWSVIFSELHLRNHIFSNHTTQACKISEYSFIWTNVTMIYYMNVWFYLWEAKLITLEVCLVPLIQNQFSQTQI